MPFEDKAGRFRRKTESETRTPPSGIQAKVTSSAHASMRGRPNPREYECGRSPRILNSPALHTSTVKRSSRCQAHTVMSLFSSGCSIALAHASETASLIRKVGSSPSPISPAHFSTKPRIVASERRSAGKIPLAKMWLPARPTSAAVNDYPSPFGASAAPATCDTPRSRTAVFLP